MIDELGRVVRHTASLSCIIYVGAQRKPATAEDEEEEAAAATAFSRASATTECVVALFTSREQ